MEARIRGQQEVGIVPLRLVLMVLWVLTSVACDTGPTFTAQICSPTNCDGCCTIADVCARGVEVSACGVGGNACVVCGAQDQCGQDGRCVATERPDGGTTPDAGVPPPVPCGATAIALTDGGAQVSGTTVGGARGAIGSCGGIDGNEVIYAFSLPSTVPSGTDMVVTVTPRDETFQPVVYLRHGSCESAQAELSRGCVSAHLPGATVQLHTQSSSSSSGMYFLFVDGLTNVAGAFNVNIEVGGRAGRNCADVIPVPGRKFTVRGTYRDSGDEFTPRCYRAGGNDRIYRLETSEPSYLRTRVEDEEGFYSSVQAVAPLCGGRENFCSYQVDSTLLPTGTHYLWLDRYLNSFDGPGYILRGEFTAPVAGDACAQAHALAFSNGAQGGTATARLEVAGLHDDGDWGCGMGNGLDAAYAFTTDRPLRFRARATGTNNNALPLSLVRSDCTVATRVACGSPTLEVAELPAGSYFLWVDGFEQESGPVNLSASLDPVAAPIRSTP
jgi:hypothetical protein